MRRIPLLFLFSLPLFFGPAFAFQGKSASAPGHVKKKAHADIKKWVKAKGRSIKIEIKFYDDLVLRGVPAKDALDMMKLVVEHHLDVGNLGHFVRSKVHGGVKGKKLAEAIHREVRARAEKKKKEKAGKPKAGKAKRKGKGKSGK